MIFPGLLLAEEEPAAATENAETEGYFISKLAQIETLTTGVHELSKLEQANLENLIAYEVSSARAGGVNGFAGGFSERRTDAELVATGIERMSDGQRVRLDEHITGFLADQPVSYVYRGDGRGPRSTRRGDNAEFRGKGPLLEVHGSVTMTVGTSSAGSFYGGSATTVISDPKGRFNAVISFGTMKGNLPYDDYRYRRGPFRR
tara:strand:- start:251 stop:859 length:609 start_codon:yes stop_codon:yes gene_type:complete